jgi:hypothetical protein
VSQHSNHCQREIVLETLISITYKHSDTSNGRVLSESQRGGEMGQREEEGEQHAWTPSLSLGTCGDANGPQVAAF